MKVINHERRGRANTIASSGRLNLIALALLLGGALGAIASPPLRMHAAGAFFEVAAGEIINTVAGGGYGSSVPVRQAPVGEPRLMARDPQGRGVYLIDNRNATYLLRFINTSSNPVTLAGATIQPGHIGLVAGGGTVLEDNIAAREFDLGQIEGLAVDATGNIVYLLAPLEAAVYALNVSAGPVNARGRTIEPGRVVVLILGVPDLARGLAVAPNGDAYTTNNQRVWKSPNGVNGFDPFAGGGNPDPGQNGDGGPALQARIISPTGVAINAAGDVLISEGGEARSASGAIRRVGSDNIISTVPGASGFDFPMGVAVAPNGDIYVPVGRDQQIYRVVNGSKTEIAGTKGVGCNPNATPVCGDGGPALQAQLTLSENVSTGVVGLAADETGVWVPSFFYPRVRYVNLSGGPVTIAGTTIPPNGIDAIVGNNLRDPYDNTLAIYSDLSDPVGVAADANGNLFITDTLRDLLRFVNRGSAAITLFNGTPSAITVQPGQIVSLNEKLVEILYPELDASGRIEISPFFALPQGVTVASNGVYFVDSRNGAPFPPQTGGPASSVVYYLNTTGAPVTLFPTGAQPIVVNPGQITIVAGFKAGRRDAPTAVIDNVLGRNSIVIATDVAVDAAGNIFIADQGNNRIRRVDGATGIITSFAEGLNRPAGVAFDTQGRLLVADTYNNRILRSEAPGNPNLIVIAESGQGINRPRDLAVVNNLIYITNAGSNQILALDAPNNAVGTTSVFAGTGAPGFSGDGGPAVNAQIRLPNPNPNQRQTTINIGALPGGGLVFADTENDRIRVITSASLPNVTTGSAASYAPEVAADSIAALFGTNLASGVANSTSTPLPEELLGTRVLVNGVAAGLFFVSPNQINFTIPPGTANGTATITVTRDGQPVASGTTTVGTVAPAIFTPNSDVTGVASANTLRIQGGTILYGPVAAWNGATFAPVPINLDQEPRPTYIALYGTGIRRTSGNIQVTVGGTPVPVVGFAPQPDFVGLDQINIGPLPDSLKGRGDVQVTVSVDGKPANTTILRIQ